MQIRYLRGESQLLKEMSDNYWDAASQPYKPAAVVTPTAATTPPPPPVQERAAPANDATTPIMTPAVLATALLDEYKAMHPIAKNIGIAFNKHLARFYPSDDTVMSGTFAGRRHLALKQIVELNQLAKEQYAMRGKLDHAMNDNARLRGVFADCFPETPRSGDILEHLQFTADDYESSNMPDTTLLLLCELLVIEWLRLFLDYGPEYDYMAKFKELDAFSQAFVDKYSPHMGPEE